MRKTKQELEDHLYTCDQCLTHYLLAIEANETSLPILSDMSEFTDSVMAEISKQKIDGIRMAPDRQDFSILVFNGC